MSKKTLLICFSTSVIIPENALFSLNRPAYNFHAASPEYPGRDPHHFAIYEGASRYGATAHEMVARVDAGPIVGVKWFDIDSGITPEDLRHEAVEAAFDLYRNLIPLLIRGQRPGPDGSRWAGRKRTRADFAAMCRIDPEISLEEFDRRYFAFDGGTHANLTIEIHGRTFRIDRPGTDSQ